MAYQGLPFAGASIKVDSVVVGIVTGAEETINVDEVEVTGVEDVSGTAPDQISAKKYRPVGVDQTVTINGIYKPGDAGQKDLRDAALAGESIDLEVLDQSGNGTDYEGFLTGFTKTGALAGVITFTANFRVNDYTDVTGS